MVTVDIYKGGNGWHWRLLTDAGTLITESSLGHKTLAEAQASFATVQHQLLGADITVFPEGTTPPAPAPQAPAGPHGPPKP